MNAFSDHRRERELAPLNGYLMIGLGIGCCALAAAAIVTEWALSAGGIVATVALLLLGAACLAGVYMLQPNEAALLILFGRYKGTDRSDGLHWANPFYRKRKISLRSRNLNAATLKVNDKRGNPVEVSAVVVWRVRDTAKAVFEVEDFERYVEVQAEAALRHLASQYAYDDGDGTTPAEPTLRAGSTVSAALMQELQERFDNAGVEVEDAKLSHLAYAPEIAQVMLRRQQAEAIISAREKIVIGAVTMVENALHGLSERNIVVLDDERKAAMVSNLLVVLCADRDAQPVINVGTLYN
jgi:regulator of protease activity HflC (stomatin/prohibitin superfamily)